METLLSSLVLGVCIIWSCRFAGVISRHSVSECVWISTCAYMAIVSQALASSTSNRAELFWMEHCRAPPIQKVQIFPKDSLERRQLHVIFSRQLVWHKWFHNDDKGADVEFCHICQCAGKQRHWWQSQGCSRLAQGLYKLEECYS